MGFDNALGEITLVLFTALSPSCAVAVAILGIELVFSIKSEKIRKRTNKYLAIPLALAMVGLVASATHLGDPGNALYVLSGVGRSPLSNEVFCAILFLALLGSYWVYSFIEHVNVAVQRVWMILVVLAALLFVVAVAFAYSAEFVITWNTPFSPIALLLMSATGGPMVAGLTMCIATKAQEKRSFRTLMAVLSTVAFLACIVVYIAQGAQIQELGNYVAFASELVPGYWPMLVAYAVLVALGIGGAYFRPQEEKRAIVRMSASCFLMFAGFFIMRFAFYMMHMTEGLGI